MCSRPIELGSYVRSASRRRPAFRQQVDAEVTTRSAALFVRRTCSTPWKRHHRCGSMSAGAGVDVRLRRCRAESASVCRPAMRGVTTSASPRLKCKRIPRHFGEDRELPIAIGGWTPAHLQRCCPVGEWIAAHDHGWCSPHTMHDCATEVASWMTSQSSLGVNIWPNEPTGDVASSLRLTELARITLSFAVPMVGRVTAEWKRRFAVQRRSSHCRPFSCSARFARFSQMPFHRLARRPCRYKISSTAKYRDEASRDPNRVDRSNAAALLAQLDRIAATNVPHYLTELTGLQDKTGTQQ